MPLSIAPRRYALLAALLLPLIVLAACGDPPNEERIESLEEETGELEDRLEQLEERVRALEQARAS